MPSEMLERKEGWRWMLRVARTSKNEGEGEAAAEGAGGEGGGGGGGRGGEGGERGALARLEEDDEAEAVRWAEVDVDGRCCRCIPRCSSGTSEGRGTVAGSAGARHLQLLRARHHRRRGAAVCWAKRCCLE